MGRKFLSFVQVNANENMETSIEIGGNFKSSLCGESLGEISSYENDQKLIQITCNVQQLLHQWLGFGAPEGGGGDGGGLWAADDKNLFLQVTEGRKGSRPHKL